MSAADEPILIARAQSGSKAAFAELMSGYEARLFRFLVTRSRSRADAEDAMQECFLNAYRYIASYNDSWRFSTWLYRIAVRELAKLPPPGGEFPEGEEADDKALDPLQACIALQDQKNLWLLARELLSEQAFNTLWLRYAEDMSVKEVAHAVRRPEPWVKVVLHRARKKLARQQRLQEKEIESNEKREAAPADVGTGYETSI